jgi:outer membrane protein OmpA-like peptidoglycan-associated protein
MSTREGTGGKFVTRVVHMGDLLSSRRAAEGRVKRAVYRLAIMAALITLADCNPVDTWRDLTGVSRNDPDPDTTPNTQNLAAGEAADYPNLATVPSPPVRAMTAADREKLTQSLIADRANARHSDEQLRAGFSATAAPPPAPPPVENAGNPEPGRTSASASPSQPPSASAPTASPSLSSADNAGSGGKSAISKPRPATAAESLAAPATGKNPVGLVPSTPTRTAGAVGKAPAEPGQGLRKQGEPPEPGPMESSLEQPQARATPQPETIQPAPPPPQLPPTPRVASIANRLPGGLSPGGALAPRVPPPSPEATGPAGFEPAPAAPELPPPSRSAEARSGKGDQKPPSANGDKPVAEIKFASNSTSLSDSEQQSIQRVVPLYQQNPGKVRIVGYAGSGSGAVEQLNSYRAALGRAQAVAAALTKAGIPSDKIRVEAAPEGAASGESRAEILFEH